MQKWLNISLLLGLLSLSIQHINAQNIPLRIHNEHKHLDERDNFKNQTNEGNIYFGFAYGMGLSYSNRKSELDILNSTVLANISLLPTVAYFPKKKWLIGINLDNDISASNINYDNKYNSFAFKLTPFTRYYLNSGLFGEIKGGTGWGFERITDQGEFIYNNLNVYKYAIGGGISNFWFKKISLEVMIHYNYQLSVDRQTSEEKSFKVFTVSAGIGFSQLFKKE
ncbi:hypothetical protein [Sediminitomix flava]|uniref:Outer membrane protein with beta-barrel domain n=1 Tax=Sediminitomix flava TaxID=379075 RepID=A0A315Z4T9_SEDFL|nr:hypothetical protein [Sediminitomix flava]PWJ38503.1 hypothetical protein BC781_10793 [Sediminitomix flava]